MDFTLTEEQKMLKTTAHDFLVDKYPREVLKEMERSEMGYSQQMWQEMADLGWIGLLLPEKYGGSEMSFIDLGVLLEEMGYVCLMGPFFSTVVLGALPILNFGSEEQKQEYLSKIASGKAIFTLALVEPHGKYDAASITVEAIRDKDGYVIDGTKSFVPNAHVADYILCVARTSGRSKSEDGITIFLVNAKSPGISCKVYKTHSHEKLCKVVFDKVKVPKENILGQLDHGWSVVQKTLEWAAVAKCCEMFGSMQEAFDMTVDYVKERRQFDRPIGSFQIIQHYIVNMAMDVEGSRVITYQAAWMLSEGLPCTKEVSAAKAWVSNALSRVITVANDCHATIGVTEDHDLHFHTIRAKAAEVTYGSADYHRELVAQEIGLNF